jgi:hypothetical protein
LHLPRINPHATICCACCAYLPSQVGVEKEKVNAENVAAQVEAQKCAVIAEEVTAKQRECEKDLAAAEPLVKQAEAALDTLNKKVGWMHCRDGCAWDLCRDMPGSAGVGCVLRVGCTSAGVGVVGSACHHPATAAWLAG